MHLGAYLAYFSLFVTGFVDFVATELPPSLPPVGMFTPRWLGAN